MSLHTIGYLGAALLVAAISWLLFRAAAGSMSLRRLNIVSWAFYYQFLGLTFVGATLTVLGVSHYVIDRAHPAYRAVSFWAASYTLLMTPLAMIVVQQLLLGGKIRRKLRSYFAAPMTVTNRQAIYWIALSALAALATIYVYVVIRRIPFVTFLMSSSTTDLALNRIASARGFGGVVYIRNILSLALAPFVSYVALGYWYVYRRPFYRVWFWGTVLVAAAALTYAGDKAPIILYFASLYFARAFIRGGVSRKTVLLAILAAFVAMILAYILFNGAQLSGALLRGLASRLFQGQYAGLPLTFSAFPDQHPFLRGASLPDWFASRLGLEHARSARVIMEICCPSQVEAGTAGVVNTIFIGEAWANFGWTGLLLAPVWVGFLLQIVHNGLLVAPKTPLTVALMTYFMTAFPITGGFVDFLWNPVVLIMAVLVLAGSLVHLHGGTLYLRTRLRYRRAGVRRAALAPPSATPDETLHDARL